MRLARVDVRSDIQRTIAEFHKLREDVSETATYRALNRALDKVATETGREIRREYNVKQSAIRSALRKSRASRRSLFARLIVEGVRLGLIEFAARAVNPWNVPGRKHRSGRGGGVSVQVKTRGARQVVKGAFLATNTATGYRGVWRRAGAARYPIRNLRSVSVPQAFANKAVLAALERVAAETFSKNFLQQVRYLSGVV